MQLFLQHLMKNLERGRSVNERLARLRHHGQPERSGVAIAILIHLQAEARGKPAVEIQQLPNRDSRFAWILAPRINRVRDTIVKSKEPVLGGGERGQIPERFRSAVDSTRRLRAALGRIFFEKRLSVLQGEERSPAMLGRIFRRFAYRR